MAIAEPTMQRFDMERVVKRTFSVVGSNAITLSVLSFLTVVIPFLILVWSASDYAQAAIDGRQSSLGTRVFLTVSWFVYLFGLCLQQATVVYGTIAHWNAKPFSLSDCLAAGVSSIFHLVALAVLIVVGLIGGLLLFIVPGLILITMWFVAIPAVIVERKGVFGALSRSRELTNGYRWPIFGLYFAYFVLAFGFTFGVGALTGSDPGNPSPATGLAPVPLIISTITIMITQTINSTLVASVYYELRQLKDGFGPEALASEFD